MLEQFGRTVPFFKMQGSGNDFVVFDNRELQLASESMAEWAAKICRRAFGIHADGVFFLETADEPGLDIRWHFFNADGSRAEMCGNASRCAARLAHLLGMAGPELTLGTDAGPVAASVIPDTNRVRVQLTEARDLRLNMTLTAARMDWTVHFVNTGVPHAVLFMDEVASADVRGLGHAIRNHEAFQPAGANVNFAQMTAPGAMRLRTYERGVEDETLACGTGAAAAAYVAKALGLTEEETKVTPTGGADQVLNIGVEGKKVFLEGPAEIVFEGVLNLEAVGL